MKVLFKLNLIFVFILFFFNGRGISNNLLVFNLDVGLAYGLILLLQIVSLFMLWTYNKFKIDKIAVLLSIQILLYTLLLLMFPDSIDSMKYYVAVLLSLVTYMFFSNYSISIMNKKILLLSEIATLIICIQLVSLTIRAFVNNIPYYLMKNYIQAPIGGSNYIGSFLLIFLVIIMNLEEKKPRKFIFLGLGVTGVLLTRSNGALVLLTIIFTLEYGKKFISKHNIIGSLKYILMFILGGFILWKLFELFPNYFERYIVSIERLVFGGIEGIAAVSNNRISLFIESFSIIAESPVIGYGLNYRNSALDMSAHNLIIDQLLKGGIINAVVFLCYIYMLFHNFHRYRNSNKEIKAIEKVVLVVIINGMFEQNLGGFNFDFFFWMFCGVGMANISHIKKFSHKSKDDMYPQENILIERCFL